MYADMPTRQCKKRRLLQENDQKSKEDVSQFKGKEVTSKYYSRDMSGKRDERGEKLITAARKGDTQSLLVSCDFMKSCCIG